MLKLIKGIFISYITAFVGGGLLSFLSFLFWDMEQEQAVPMLIMGSMFFPAVYSVCSIPSLLIFQKEVGNNKTSKMLFCFIGPVVSIICLLLVYHNALSRFSILTSAIFFLMTYYLFYIKLNTKLLK